eukprot:1193638-Rhodomonas_salina.1
MARPAPAASTSSSELSTSTSTSGSEAGVSAGEEGLCVVVCEVNEAGQFMLRELLEGGATKTHRYAINKAQVRVCLPSCSRRSRGSGSEHVCARK